LPDKGDKIMKTFCKKCRSEFEGKAQAKTGFCQACVEAIARGEAQTKAIESRKLKTAESPKK